MAEKKIAMYCSTCGSKDVLVDAYASWNEDKQEWEVYSTFDKGSYCNKCEGECRIVEVEIKADPQAYQRQGRGIVAWPVPKYNP